MFHMTNDSRHFRTAKELEDEGYWPAIGNVYRKGPSRYLPLYEGKMVQMYDHRAAKVVVLPKNVHRPAGPVATTLAEHSNADFAPRPQFWIEAKRVSDALGTEPQWLLGYKDVTAPTNVRTMIASAMPPVGVGNTLCLVSSPHAKLKSCLLANLNSFVLDFAARQKVGGQHLNFFIVQQLPVLPPERYADDFKGVNLMDFVNERVLELCYTAHDLQGFADALGYTGAPFAWDEERRLHLRCQLDALYFHLYGLTRAEAMEVLETFPIVKRQDIASTAATARRR
jgi:hypothetical protein